MVVRMPPMARSMTVLPPPSLNSTNTSYPFPFPMPPPVSSNYSHVPPYPYHYPSYPYPPPPPPLPFLPMPLPPPPPIHPSPPPTNYNYIPLKTTKQPFYNQIFFDHNINHETRTTSRSRHKTRPLYHYKPQKSPQEHFVDHASKKVKHPAHHYNSVDNDHKHSNMYPMPRNYQNHRIDDQLTLTSSPPTSTTTTKSTTTVTRMKVAESKEQLRPGWLTENEIQNISKQFVKDMKRFTTPSSVSPNNRGMNPRLKYTRIRVRTTTPLPTTATTKEVMTPAPIENYRPVRARIGHKKTDSKDKLMFDESQNLYYYGEWSSMKFRLGHLAFKMIWLLHE